MGAFRWTAARFTSWAAVKSTVASIDVATGPTAGGTDVVITGTLLLKNGVKRITFGDVDATLGTIGASTAECTSPASEAEGVVDVVLYPVYGHPLTLAEAFTYADYVAPTIISLTPNSGDDNGGETVRLAGTNLLADGDGGSYKLFLGLAAVSWGDMTWIDENTIDFVTPNSIGGGTVDVTLSDDHTGSNTLVGGFTFNP